MRCRAAFVVSIISATFADGTPMPMALIAKDCGFRHPQRLINLLRSPDGVPIAQRPLFDRVARLLRYPADRMFVTTDSAPRLVKRATADEADANRFPAADPCRAQLAARDLSS